MSAMRQSETARAFQHATRCQCLSKLTDTAARHDDGAGRGQGSRLLQGCLPPACPTGHSAAAPGNRQEADQ
jgi:hypothetical protein